MRHPVVAALILALSALLTGCGRLDPAVSTPEVESIRTDAGSSGLVARYTGGACDGPSRLSVTETADRVDVTVLVEPDPDGPENCVAIGVLRTVSVRLDAPVGDRQVWSRGRRLQPFDGARLLVPSALPAGFAPVREGGESTDSGVVTTSWTTTYEQTPATQRRDRCTPTAGSLQVTVGRAFAAQPQSGWSKVGTARIQTASADLWRQDSAGVEGWAYVWEGDQGVVEVSNDASCVGDVLLDRTALLAVARSLRPA